MSLAERQKPRYDRELQSHRDILSLFKTPCCISLDDIATKAGYSRSITRIRVQELIGMDKLKKTTYPHIWGKPNRYEATQ